MPKNQIVKNLIVEFTVGIKYFFITESFPAPDRYILKIMDRLPNVRIIFSDLFWMLKGSEHLKQYLGSVIYILLNINLSPLFLTMNGSREQKNPIPFNIIQYLSTPVLQIVCNESYNISLEAVNTDIIGHYVNSCSFV